MCYNNAVTIFTLLSWFSNCSFSGCYYDISSKRLIECYCFFCINSTLIFSFPIPIQNVFISLRFQGQTIVRVVEDVPCPKHRGRLEPEASRVLITSDEECSL
jgi:hypothetical protein